MTREQLTKLTIPLPFAGGANASRFSIGLESGTLPNYTDGFPANYSAPRATGGSFILRSQMNGLGNMASHNQWFNQAGGYYTFDGDWCNANGGYPKDAILHHIYGGAFVAVKSLVDNNTFNFIDNGIDGIHWEICSASSNSIPTFDISKRNILWNSMVGMTDTLESISENIVMPFDGYVNYLSSVNCSIGAVSLGVITSIANNVPVQTVVPLLDPSVYAASLFGVIMGVSTPLVDGQIADDVLLDTTNYVAGERNCAVFDVDGIGLARAGAGCGLIPVKKGSKIKLFGQETFSKTYSVTYNNSTGGTITTTTNGAFNAHIRLEAYPIFTTTQQEEE